MKKKYHFIAIGGIGMSGLAKYLLENGCEVSGSDIKESKYIDKIAGKPLNFMLGYKPFTIKQNYAIFPDGTAKPILSDTEDIYKILEQWKR